MTRKSPRLPRLTRRDALAGLAAAGALVSAGGIAIGRAAASATAYEDDWAYGMDHQSVYDRWVAQGVKPGKDGLLRLGIAVRYRTDPARMKKLLFPPLEPDPEGHCQINYFILMLPPGGATVFLPGPTYGESDLMMGCLYEGKRCMTSLPWILDHDFGRYAGRENIQLRKKAGRILFDVVDGRMIASTTRQGATTLRIDAAITEAPAHPLFWHREVGWGEIRADYRLAPNWTEALFDEGPIDIWRGTLGSENGYPTGLPAEADLPRAPRAVDMASLRVDLGEPSPTDPFAELPILEILGASASYGPNISGAGIKVPRGPDGVMSPSSRGADGTSGTILLEADKTLFAPFAFSAKAYDPPVFGGVVPVPEGWPARGTLVALEESVFARYRARPALVDEADTLVDLEFDLDGTLSQQAMPPGLDQPARPGLKILAAAVRKSDLSVLAFTDLWLMLAASRAGEDLWVPLSHVTSWDGDTLFGRETFGYPTKMGEPRIEDRADGIDIVGHRFHIDFLRLGLVRTQARAMPLTERYSVAGYSPPPVGRKETTRLVIQPWEVEFDYAEAVPAGGVRLSLPQEPSPSLIGRSDPWFEFASARLRRCLLGRGTIRRLPGRTADRLETARIAPPLRDRFDDYRGENVPVGSTFLVNPL